MASNPPLPTVEDDIQAAMRIVSNNAALLASRVNNLSERIASHVAQVALPSSTPSWIQTVQSKSYTAPGTAASTLLQPSQTHLSSFAAQVPPPPPPPPPGPGTDKRKRKRVLANGANPSKRKAAQDADRNFDPLAVADVDLQREQQLISSDVGQPTTRVDSVTGAYRAAPEDMVLDAKTLQRRIETIAQSKALRSTENVSHLIGLAVQSFVKDCLDQLILISKLRSDTSKYRNDLKRATLSDPRKLLASVERAEREEATALQEAERRRLLEEAQAVEERLRRDKANDMDEETRLQREKAETLLRLEQQRISTERANKAANIVLGKMTQLSFAKRTVTPAAAPAQLDFTAQAVKAPPSNLVNPVSEQIMANKIPDTRKINIQDVTFLLENSHWFSKSDLLFRSYLKWANEA